MDYTIHGLLQARILEWVTVPFSRGSSQPRSCPSGHLVDWGTMLSHGQAQLSLVMISSVWKHTTSEDVLIPLMGHKPFPTLGVMEVALVCWPGYCSVVAGGCFSIHLCIPRAQVRAAEGGD